MRGEKGGKNENNKRSIGERKIADGKRPDDKREGDKVKRREKSTLCTVNGLGYGGIVWLLEKSNRKKSKKKNKNGDAEGKRSKNVRRNKNPIDRRHVARRGCYIYSLEYTYMDILYAKLGHADLTLVCGKSLSYPFESCFTPIELLPTISTVNRNFVNSKGIPLTFDPWKIFKVRGIGWMSISFEIPSSKSLLRVVFFFNVTTNIFYLLRTFIRFEIKSVLSQCYRNITGAGE